MTIINKFFAFAGDPLEGIDHFIPAHGDVKARLISMQQSAGRKVDLAVAFGQQPQTRTFNFQNNRAHDLLTVDKFNDAS